MPPNNLEGVIAQEQKLCLKSPCNQENNNALEDDEGNADGKPRNEDAVPDENEVVELGTAPCVDNVRSFVLEDQAVSVVISDGAGIIGASSHSLEDARMLSLSVVRHDDKLNGLVQSLREAWLERRPTIDDLEILQVLRNPTEFLTSLMPWTMEDDFVLSALETFVTKDSGYTWSAQIIGFFLLHSAVQKSIYPQATNFSTELPDMNKVSMTKEEDSTYLQTVGDLKSKRSKRMAEIASIASMVRTKQEEAMMFQMQADEANGAASNLRRIISAKQEKIEQDFAYKSAQLRLSEAEDKRKKMLEELQVLERAQHDYRRMKIMMEVQIKDLLMKLGVSKWQYA